MGGFGVTGLLVEENGKTQILSKQRGVREGFWTKNFIFNFDRAYQTIASGKGNIHSYLQSHRKEVVLVETSGFVANGNTIFLGQLYPGFEKYFAVFIRKGYTLGLLTIGSKTIDEYRACGHDTYLKSRLPLIITISGERAEAVNIKPFLKSST